MVKILKKWYWVVIGGFILFVAILFSLRGENSIIAVHDNLDLFTPQYQMMKDTGTFFGTDLKVPFLDNISRDVLPSEFSLTTMLYMIFPSFAAYVIAYILKIAIAVAGGALLAREYLKDKFSDYESLAFLCAFGYGILNLFPNFGISFASIPLLCFIIRRITVKPHVLWYVALLFYPFLSYFSYFGIFLIGYLVVYFVYEWIARKKFPGSVLIAIPVLSLGYFGCEWRLFKQMLFDSTETIRTSMVLGDLGVKDILVEIWNGIAVGDMHSEALQLYFVMPAVLIWVVIQTILYIKKKEQKKIVKDPLNWVVVVIILNGVVYGLYNSEAVRDLFETVIPPLSGFQFGRTGFFNPFLWYVALFIVCKRLFDFLPKCKWLANIPLLIAALVTILSGTRYNDLKNTCVDIVKEAFGNEGVDQMSYSEFFSEDLFETALEDIGYDGEWSAAYGIYPAVLEYNGIKTIDGYLGYYSQFYKECFRGVIAPALDRVPESAEYFDNWGARCYLYSGNYPSITNAGRHYEYTEDELFINLNEFKDQGGRYIFSRLKLTNADEVGMHEVNHYSSADSPYTLYVYENNSWYVEKEHYEIPFEDRDAHIDQERMKEICKNLKDYAEEASKIKESEDLTDEEVVEKLGTGTQVLALYDELQDELSSAFLLYNIMQIDFNRDVTDTELSDKMNESMEIMLVANDESNATIRELVNSPYKTVLKERISSYVIDSFLDYEDMTDEELERSTRMEALGQEYEKAMAEEYSYEYKGKTWTMDSLMEEGYTMDQEDALAIYNGIIKEQALAVGEIYLEILDLCYEDAESEDYENYPEYCYDCVYLRDYEPEDVDELCKQIRGRCRNYVVEIQNMGENFNNDPGWITEDDRATFEMLLPVFEDIDPELGVSLRHLLNCNLFDLKSTPNRSNRGFTISFDKYNDAFIFDSPYQSMDDLFTYVHEFGHYNADYYKYSKDYEEVTNLDLSEMQSQGLEVLAADYYPYLLGQKVGTTLTYSEISNLVNAIYQGCMVTEFENYAHYHHGELTVEDLGRKYKEICEKYGYSNNDEEVYNWINISHLFVSPCYYISYATSALGALELYAEAQIDRDSAVRKYMQMSSMRQLWGYRETINFVGMDDVFERGVPRKIFQTVYKRLRNLEG